ncbi:MAG: hypothetical protein HY671_07410 [Chloroflexi bacterium]|nr:hypothetical protein [Chloroflexota bacterium]
MAALSLQDSGHSLPEVIQTDKVFEAFYHLREKYPQWLDCLYFQSQANMYVSRGLEDVLFALGAFGLVTVENHDYRSLKLDNQTRNEIKKHVIAKSSGDLKTLRKMSNEFAEIVKK